MRVTCCPLPLELIHPFKIAHGVSHRRDNVLVRVGQGVGEAACVPYRSETPQSVAAYVGSLDWERLGWNSEKDPLHITHTAAALPRGPMAARAAVDMALYDVWAGRLGAPLFRCLGLDAGQIALTSQTIAQASPEQMAKRVTEISGPIAKLKVGEELELDLARIRAVLAARECAVRVDANAGWSVAQAERALPELLAQGVELVEQPLPVGDWEGLRHLSKLSSRPPLYADESIESVEDIVAHAGLVEGVVVKLAKAGGIFGALEQIAVARALGLKVMLSCMVESSVAVTAAAHVAALADKVDLDGPLLIASEPYAGVRFERGRLILPETPGLGLVAKPE